MSIEKFDRLVNEQHPETIIERWLDLPEDQPFRLTDATFGQSNFADKDTGDYSTNCILSLEDNQGSARRVWSCNSRIALLEKEVPLEFEKKAYFVVNNGPTKTGKNRTFHQSAVISTALRGGGAKAPAKLAIRRRRQRLPPPPLSPLLKRIQPKPLKGSNAL